jgi:hypothetical protein
MSALMKPPTPEEAQKIHTARGMKAIRPSLGGISQTANLFQT